jgi:hypothetical protein
MVRKMMVMLGVILALGRVAGADWTPPADKIFTEDQLNTYITTTNDWLDENAKIMQVISQATNTAERMAAVSDLDAQRQACFDRHHISSDEYNWLGERTVEAYGVAAYVQEAYAKMQVELQGKLKDNDDQMADAQKRLAIDQQAQKDGVRVMTPQDRDAATKQAQSDQQAALADAKQHDDDAKAAETEAKQHDADASAADDLASNPPPDVMDTDRAAYIAQKKTEAQAARDAAKDCRSQEADAEKAKADSLAKAVVFAQTSLHPDVPQTDDEKASVKSDNDAAVAQAQADMTQCQQNKDAMTQEEAQRKQSLDQMEKDVPAANVALMQKHLTEYQQMFQRSAGGGATTQPTN